MIYDDQPQVCGRPDTESFGVRRAHLVNAFAAIDREALIEKVASELPRSNRVIPFTRREITETVLVAAGIISEGEGHPPESTMREYRA